MAECFINVCLFFIMVGLYNAVGIEPDHVCKDRLVNCDAYSQDFCTVYPNWADTNCEKYCQRCVEPYCPPEWSLYTADQTCILAVINETQRSTWFQAMESCKSKGGNLVSIRDKKKNEFVLDLLNAPRVFWIGLINVGKVNTFLFHYISDSHLLGSFHPWIPDNPDMYNGVERCVVMLPKTSNKYSGYWNDQDCMYYLAYVCEKPTETL